MARGTSVRWFNIAIGTWLFFSAFLWTHTYAQFTNTWIVGIVCALSAAIALRVSGLRFLNAALAVWLFISVWALPLSGAGTFWNNLLASIAMFIVALVPDQPVGALPPGRQRPVISHGGTH